MHAWIENSEMAQETNGAPDDFHITFTCSFRFKSPQTCPPIQQQLASKLAKKASLLIENGTGLDSFGYSRRHIS
jgi:hypothetical protein